MGSKDMRIVQRIRGILGKHFLDLFFVHISSTKGKVRIVGEFKRLGPLTEIMPITEKFLNDLKGEIKRLPGVKRVVLTKDDEEGL